MASSDDIEFSMKSGSIQSLLGVTGEYGVNVSIIVLLFRI